MEPCNAVEREVDKVLQKFGAIKEHADKTLTDLIKHIESLKNELEAGTNPLPLAQFILIPKQSKAFKTLPSSIFGVILPTH